MGGGSLATDATAGAIPRRRSYGTGRVRCGWLVAWGADTTVEIERDGIKRCQA